MINLLKRWLSIPCLVGIFLVLAVTVLTTCGTGQQSVEHTYKVTTEDGVETAINSGGPRFTVPVFSFEHLFRIEQDEAHEESLLYSFN